MPSATLETVVEEAGRTEKVRSPLSIALRNFWAHRPARIGAYVLAVLYFIAIFADFVAPYGPDDQVRDLQWSPPTALKWRDENGRLSWPYIHPKRGFIDEETFEIRQREDTTKKAYLRFFHRGAPYRWFGLFESRLRLFGFEDMKADNGGEPYITRFYLFGADLSGRCLFSRICFGARISMSIGLVGASLVFVIGMLIGGASGYFGGWVDNMLQRLGELVMLLPGFYLLLMLRFIFPLDMPSWQVYFAIIAILALVGWPGLARVIRGMVLAIRSSDFVAAAQATGCGNFRIIVSHILPNTMSYAIVAVTLAIPGYILGESALSLLGLGITEPTPSWGNMLQKAMDITELQQHPWVLIPGVFIFVAVIAFNLVGDGLRDAFDPKLRKRD